MLEPGDGAPEFSLPGARGEEIRTFDSDEYEETITVLAFYPMDFSPSCTEELEALREMELFSISEAVDLLAISADSAYAHRAFAREYDLEFPLLSDRTGEVASRYGVLADEIEGHKNVPRRSVFVIDPQGTIRYTWASEDPTVVPDPDDIRSAVESITDDRLAVDQFEDAHSTFNYGRSEFENGRNALTANNDEFAVETFAEASSYFDAATSAFSRANRYADADDLAEAAEIAESKARRLQQASEWFHEAAERRLAGESDLAEEIRADAEDAVAQANQFAAIEDLYDL